MILKEISVKLTSIVNDNLHYRSLFGQKNGSNPDLKQKNPNFKPASIQNLLPESNDLIPI